MSQPTVEGFRLSPQQQRLWSVQEGDYNPAFRTWTALRIDGAISIDALKDGLRRLTLRHEILRTRFDFLPGMDTPVQIIAEEPAFDWRETAACEAPKNEEEAADWAAQRALADDRPFNLQRGPALRAELCRIDARRSYLWLSLPALCSDLRGLQNLIRELAGLLASPEERDDDHEGPLQYVDISEWLHELLTSEDTAAGRAYWRRLEPPEGGEPRCAGEKPGPLSDPFDPSSVAVALTPDLARSAAAFAHALELPLSAALLACWQAVLHRLTDSNNLLVSVGFDGRKFPDLEALPGLFAKQAPCQVPLERGVDFDRLARATGEALAQHYAWQEFYDWRIGASAEKGPARIDSIPFGFNFIRLPESFSAGEAAFSFIGGGDCLEPFKLRLWCSGSETQPLLRLEFDTRCFEEFRVAWIVENFKTFLKRALVDPRVPVEDIDLVGPGERSWLLRGFNDAADEGPPPQCLLDLFESQAARTPERNAVAQHGEHAETALSFQALNQRAGRLARYLAGLGIGREGRVAVYMERSPELMVALFGVMKAGAAYVPLDPTYPRERLRHMIRDAEASLTLTHDATHSKARALGAQTLNLSGDWEMRTSAASDWVPPQPDPASLAYVLYTSGSTGRPKGVMVSHAGLASYLDWCIKGYCRDGGDALAHTSISFDATVTSLFPPLLTGARVVLLREGHTVEELAAAMVEPGVGLVKLTPSHLMALASIPKRPPIHGALPLLVVGGEQLDGQTLAFLRSWAPQTRIVNEYGPTETVVGCCIHETRAAETPPGPVPIGAPIANTRLYVLDANMRLAPSGRSGELFIGGAGVARGYWRRPGLTAAAFVPDPFGGKSGSRLYRTGDQARMSPDGLLEFVGRKDHQIKIRGYRVELGEIESTLKLHPAVRAGAAAACRDARGVVRLAAYVVFKDDAPQDKAALSRFLGEQLPDYATPQIFVVLKNLPLTPNGKLDRARLPQPDLSRQASRDYSAPRNPREQGLAQIWSELLGVKEIGIHDNFFEMGGDSILSIQMVARARRLGIQLQSKHLYESQTIAELAVIAADSPVVQAEQGLVSGSAVLSPIQQWLLDQDLSDPHHYNMSVLLEAHERLDRRCLAEAVTVLLRHHDALRLRFHRDGHAWRQRFADPDAPMARPHFECRDLSATPINRRAAALEAAAAEIQRGLNLAEGPIFRVTWFDFGPDVNARLLIVAHHLAVDGVSWRILLEDLPAAYRQIRANQPLRLPPKTTSFKKWTSLLAAYADSEAAHAELAHWNACLDREYETLVEDDSANLQASARTARFTLSAELTEGLLRQAPTAYRTEINDLLLTALALAFQRWRGRPGLLLAMEGHGREELFEQTDLSRTVGWLTSLFPVYLMLESADIGAAVKTVKERLRAIPNRGIGYGVLRFLSRDPDVAERLSSIPRPEVSFNYLGQIEAAGQTAQAKSLFALAGESVGPEYSEKQKRSHVFDFNAVIMNGRFQLACIYSANLHQEQEVHRLGKAFLESLSAVIEHCRAPHAGGLTPSDAPDTGLDQIRINLIETQYGAIEDVYPVSALQHGMLFHSLMEPTSGFYAVQMSYGIRGELDVDAFKAAWRKVIETHGALRTLFIDLDQTNPLQVVRKSAPLPWRDYDWRDRNETARQEGCRRLLEEDLHEPFHLDAAPLMRMHLARMGPQAYRFVWTHHHAILDGWSIPRVIQDLFYAYSMIHAGESPTLEPPRPFREFIRFWLRRRDREADRRFWRDYLRGIRESTPLPERPGGDVSNDIQECVRPLPSESFEKLRAAARENKLTVNIFALAAWGLLLARYSNRTDVVFGVTGSGRPADLPGVESMVGSFVVTLPVRIHVDERAPVLPWLRQIHQQQIERDERQYFPLNEIQRCTELPGDVPLFESQLVYHNYPVDQVQREARQTDLVLEDIAAVARNSFPLRVLIEPGAHSLSLIFDPKRFQREDMERMLGHYAALLQSLAANRNCALSAIAMKTESELSEEREQKASLKKKRLQALRGLKGRGRGGSST